MLSLLFLAAFAGGMLIGYGHDVLGTALVCVSVGITLGAYLTNRSA